MSIRYIDSIASQSIQLKSASVYSDQTNVPICISEVGIEDFLDKVYRSDGQDIVVTDSSNNIIPREIVYFDKATKKLELHLLDSSISTTLGGTELTLQCGGTSVNISDDTTLWRDYALVVHGQDTSANTIDSAGKYSLTDSSLTYSQTGKIKDAPSFNGTDSNINCGFISETDYVAKLSLMCWISQTDVSSTKYICHEYEGGSLSYGITTYYAGIPTLYIYTSDANTSYGIFPHGLSNNEFGHIVSVFDGFEADNTSRLKSYVNKVQITDSTFVGTIPAKTANFSGTGSFRIGAGGSAFNGIIDEFRIYKGALSEDQIKTQYDIQSGFSTNAAITIGDLLLWEEGTIQSKDSTHTYSSSGSLSYNANIICNDSTSIFYANESTSYDTNIICNDNTSIFNANGLVSYPSISENLTTIDVNQTKIDMVSPAFGVYYVQNVWILDSTTLQPVGMKHIITLGP